MWLKIKVWTKVVLFGLLMLYVLIFVINNTGKPVRFWYWWKQEPEMSVLMLVMFAFLTGVIGTILLRTTFTTVRQITELQSRNKSQRLAREVEAMKAKAASLQTVPTGGLIDPHPNPPKPVE